MPEHHQNSEFNKALQEEVQRLIKIIWENKDKQLKEYCEAYKNLWNIVRDELFRWWFRDKHFRCHFKNTENVKDDIRILFDEVVLDIHNRKELPPRYSIKTISRQIFLRERYFEEYWYSGWWSKRHKGARRVEVISWKDAKNGKIPVGEDRPDDYAVIKRSIKKIKNSDRRKTLHAWFFERLKIKEIAEKYKMNENTVKGHIKKGKEELRRFPEMVALRRELYEKTSSSNYGRFRRGIMNNIIPEDEENPPGVDVI